MAVLNRTMPRVQPRAGVRLRAGPLLVGAGIVIVVMALLQIVQTSEATTTSFAIQELEREKLELGTQVRQLEAELASLSSLQRVEREARRLGLRPPAEQQTVQVNVAWAAADDAPLPSRFAPEESAAEPVQQDAPWWRDLLGLLPLN